MISISSSDISFSKKAYIKYNTINFYDTTTISGVSINVFSYDSANYKALLPFYGEADVYNFGSNIGLLDPINYSTSGLSFNSTATGSINFTTTGHGSSFIYFPYIKLDSSKTYNFSFKASTTGAGVTGNILSGLQYFNETSSTFTQYVVSAGSNFVVTTTGYSFSSSNFQPLSSGFYRIILSGASGINNYISYTNVSLTFPNYESLLKSNPYYPLQLIVIKISKVFFKDYISSGTFTLNGILYNITNIQDDLLSEEFNYIITNSSNNKVGHIFINYGLIVLESYPTMKNSTSPYLYTGIRWGNAPSGISAYLDNISFSGVNNNYIVQIKKTIADTESNYTNNPKMLDIYGDAYRSSVFFTGFNIYSTDSGAESGTLSNKLISGKVSKPVKKNKDVGIKLFIKSEN